MESGIQIKEGERIVKKITERVTLNLFREGCEKTNYRILLMLPTEVDILMKEFGLTKMPMNKRLNDLEHVGLLKRDRYTGKVGSTNLTKNFINMIEELKKDIVKELPNLI